MCAELDLGVSEYLDAVVRRHELDISPAEILRHRAAVPVPPPRLLDDGAVHVDLVDSDREYFERLLGTMPRPWCAEKVAAEAQAWRLPVVPYRRRKAGMLQPYDDPPSPPLRAGVRVVELTTMWAGPLAGHLLARLDAAVVTRIVHPRRPEPTAYRHLGEGKVIRHLDLTTGCGYSVACQLIRSSDVLITNFSRRVLPNLGLDDASLRRLNPHLLHIAISGFDPGKPESDWVTFGAGVHAMAGLGDAGAAGFRQAPFSYPDPLAGVASLIATRRALAARRTGRLEVSLMSAVVPLLIG